MKQCTRTSNQRSSKHSMPTARWHEILGELCQQDLVHTSPDFLNCLVTGVYPFQLSDRRERLGLHEVSEKGGGGGGRWLHRSERMGVVCKGKMIVGTPRYASCRVCRHLYWGQFCCSIPRYADNHVRFGTTPHHYIRRNPVPLSPCSTTFPFRSQGQRRSDIWKWLTPWTIN